MQEFQWHRCMSSPRPRRLGDDWWVWSTDPHAYSIKPLLNYSEGAQWADLVQCRHAFTNPFTSKVQIWAQQMICNPLGACVDLRYLNLLNGTIANTSTDAVGNATECSLLDVGKHDSTNCSFSLHRETCVQPPFAFLLSSDPTFNCSQTPCTLSGCWSGYPVFAILVYRPSYVWVPVNASDWVGPVTQTISTKNFQFANPAMPSRNKRNVKNWLLRVGGLAASLFIPAVGDAVLHAWTSDQIALTMNAVNNLANATRDALRAQSQQIDLNSQAILQLQSEIDELGLEIDGLWKVVQEMCDTR
ncbi:uncharacterized protein LOC143649856 [Tamandua tetradactyla]|uniref:uncharacterized protein LOC143649856 n=1 Tax=Tamandua tetradactyla TaxID=48850 RepID=UPI00405488AD